MIINDFLEKNISGLKQIVNECNKPEFSSHDFLQKFAKKYEVDYIGFLNGKIGVGAFQKVHSQIARFLSDNSRVLGIDKTRREKSKNVFGEEDIIQWWTTL